jgi:hypothetical protein
MRRHRFGTAGAYGVGVVAPVLAALVAARLPDLEERRTPGFRGHGCRAKV